jgi:hypothetical protein
VGQNGRKWEIMQDEFVNYDVIKQYRILNDNLKLAREINAVEFAGKLQNRISGFIIYHRLLSGISYDTAKEQLDRLLQIERDKSNKYIEEAKEIEKGVLNRNRE